MSTTRNMTQIEAVPDLPVIRITREFDAPRERVFLAHVDRELFIQWIGPRSVGTTVTDWDARTGGRYAYRNTRPTDGLDTGFYGSFHEVREPERIVQTFTWEGAPDGVSLETVTFAELPGGRCRIVATSVVETIEGRDAILASGMDVGVKEGFEKLDGLLEGR
ncbi:SRPBCC family protein [Nocardioides mangrovi]|uniref:SRPBCC family protein n=1 Tax=Nocardioides mangrovi TaxID=2874580 RepID=A0ABS7UCY6_9ACTN|nr:SRPBCC family protein [Nocardioides mangrovi]MBZ5738523.1 SRPBCC family protein [Nocardioides mangrovi]